MCVYMHSGMCLKTTAGAKTAVRNSELSPTPHPHLEQNGSPVWMHSVAGEAPHQTCPLLCVNLTGPSVQTCGISVTGFRREETERCLVGASSRPLTRPSPCPAAAPAPAALLGLGLLALHRPGWGPSANSRSGSWSASITTRLFLTVNLIFVSAGVLFPRES